jgi:L-seryl-tRNA(Ser) seleniumtransferase
MYKVEAMPVASQIGSGSLPVDRLPSFALSIQPQAGIRHPGTAFNRLAAAFRRLPIPVLGRISDDRFLLDLRCLEDEKAFVDQLPQLGRELA